MKASLLLIFAVFFGVFAMNATATTYYVNVNSANPTPPYTSWSTAATNIQSAINSAGAGSLVLVTNGLYNLGG